MLKKYFRKYRLHSFLLFLGCLYLSCQYDISFAREQIKRERPAELFSPDKIPLLEDPKRDKWQKPEQIINALGIGDGLVVADIGAGSGYLTVRLSERVGKEGKVYATDIQKEMLEYMRNRFTEKGIKNIIIVSSEMNDPKLPSGSLDVAILLSVYHDLEAPVAFIKKVRAALKPYGKLAILEFTDESPIGPPLKYRLPEDIVINELKQAGFMLVQRHTFLLPYQYFLVFTPSEE